MAGDHAWDGRLATWIAIPADHRLDKLKAMVAAGLSYAEAGAFFGVTGFLAVIYSPTSTNIVGHMNGPMFCSTTGLTVANRSLRYVHGHGLLVRGSQ